MSYSPTASASFGPENTEGSGWRTSGSITGSLVLHLLLVAGLIYESNRHPLEMAGKEGGVMAFTMVNMASQPVSVPPVSSPPVENSPQPPVVHSVRIEHPAPAIVLPEPVKPKPPVAKPEPKTIPKTNTRETSPQTTVKTTKPTTTRTVTPAPAKPEESKSQSLSQTQTQSKSTSESASLTPSKSPSTTNNVSAATAGNSDSGQAAQGSGNATNQNVKALHRRVNYPQRAKSLGVEGRVRIKFDITSSGTVTNVRVLSETPTGVFASAIDKDIARWRYQTQGEVKDQVVSIVFKLNGKVALEN
ncbi:TonB family protein [Klebsiella sp. BIGb0407]|uniref:TonB family protein n=1 Tax=Klebsiella sp. BIGb0407 TaxID=2940603 RepID=UPI0021680DD7|nr:TonB family protein [Klebsiella sp. BIGb0407]MCS3432073.1 TonB family protein [Klebsiella sp. BIGb0407]